MVRKNKKRIDGRGQEKPILRKKHANIRKLCPINNEGLKLLT